MPVQNMRGICKLYLIKDDIDYHIEFVVDKKFQIVNDYLIDKLLSDCFYFQEAEQENNKGPHEEETPWTALASVALFKLFNDWQVAIFKLFLIKKEVYLRLIFRFHKDVLQNY